MNGPWLATLMTVVLCWVVSAVPIRVKDGDTFIARMPVWIGLEVTETVRVLGVDTPERKGATLQAAEQAKRFTERWLVVENGPVLVRACKRDSFGRILGRVTRQRLTEASAVDDLAEALVRAGHGASAKER